MPQVAVILPAAGKSSRFADKNYKKVYAPLDGRPVWLRSMDRFVNRPEVKQVIVVIAPEDREMFQMKFAGEAAILGIEIVEGGAERADSVGNALKVLRAEIDLVAVHDAARPCIADAWIDEVIATAEKTGAAILANPVVATLKRVGDQDLIEETVSRERLWEAQTPQVFRRDWLEQSYANRGDFQPTDEASLLEREGHPVSVVKGSPLNLKITSQEDLKLASLALKALPKPKLENKSHPFENDDLWR